jgi:hypothetical protein
VPLLNLVHLLCIPGRAMDSSYSTPSRRSYELPKPDTGLAEWTSKIKAMQKQVDDDDENEQKTLEEEIAAARQARLRRSFGSGGGSRVDRVDLCTCLSSPSLPASQFGGFCS